MVELNSLTPSQEIRIRLNLPSPDAKGSARITGGLPPASTPPGRRSDLSQLRRRQISHDIHHELGTIMMLASMLSTSAEIDENSRRQARLIVGETRWLDQLHLAYEAAIEQGSDVSAPGPDTTRLDLVAAEVVEAARLSTMTKISWTFQESTARIERLAFWRGLRNLVDNAARAAGPDGQVKVMITNANGWVTTQVDDDGPGFGAIPAGRASLGLGIVQQMVASVGGQLEIERGALGGSCVRILLPAAPADWTSDQ